MGLHRLHIPQKWDARLIWVEKMKFYGLKPMQKLNVTTAFDWLCSCLAMFNAFTRMIIRSTSGVIGLLDGYFLHIPHSKSPANVCNEKDI